MSLTGSLYGDMESGSMGTDLFPVGEVPTEPAQPEPAEALNAVAKAVINPVQAAADILSPEAVEQSGLPVWVAVLGLCVVAVMWAQSWTKDK